MVSKLFNNHEMLGTLKYMYLYCQTPLSQTQGDWNKIDIPEFFEILVQCIGVKYKTYTEVTVWILWLTGPRNHPARAVHVPHHNQCPPGGVSIYYSESTGHVTGYSFQEGNTCTA